jgi:1-acyl-sn-glycerol-3-phosphate acyltransferase
MYRALRGALRIGVDVYYLEIESTGVEHVPDEGPVIFAANHPNSIMDTFILGSQIDRKVHYLARSGLFANPLVAWLFDRCGVIPLYRRQDDPTQTERNRDSFERAYELLAEGDCLGIFPEGRNAPERAVLEIKTGTARIALGAESRCGYDLGVKIVPVGLNFSNRDRFLTNVLVRFGEPLDARRWAEAHRDDARAAVRDMTEELEERIRREATHIDDARTLRLVETIIRLYGRDFLSDLEHRGIAPSSGVEDHPGELDAFFREKQRLADVLERARRERPRRVEDLEIAVARYRDHLRQVELRHDFDERPAETLSTRREALKFTAYALAFAVPAGWGFLHNAVPYLLTYIAASRAPDEAMRAVTALLTGALFFSAFYGGYGWLLFSATGSLWGMVAYLLTLPVSGFFFLRYRRQLICYRDRILARTLFRTERALFETLMRERERLVAIFDRLRARYG